MKHYSPHCTHYVTCLVFLRISRLFYEVTSNEQTGHTRCQIFVCGDATVASQLGFVNVGVELYNCVHCDAKLLSITALTMLREASIDDSKEVLHVPFL